MLKKCNGNKGWKCPVLNFGEWKNFCCLHSVKGCDSVFSQLSVWQTQQVFTFIKDYLLRHSSSGILENGITLPLGMDKSTLLCLICHVQFKDSVLLFPGFSCVQSINDDERWLVDNFGQFRVEASYVDFVTLKSNFIGVSGDI